VGGRIRQSETETGAASRVKSVVCVVYFESWSEGKRKIERKTPKERKTEGEAGTLSKQGDREIARCCLPPFIIFDGLNLQFDPSTLYISPLLLPHLNNDAHP